MENAIGLVMTGGGARGAYQAGVLKRIGEIKRVQTHGNPFPIIGGTSAGAINGSGLAVGSNDFALATKVVAQLWSGIRPSDVFSCNFLSQTGNSLTWILDLSFGGILGGGHAHSLLDATPLRDFLSKHIDCDRIQENIKRGHLFALAISATNYNTGKQLSLHSGQERPPHVEQKPAGNTCDKDYCRSYLRVGRYSIGLQPGTTSNTAGNGVFRGWLRAPATASQPGHTPGGKETSGDRCSRRKSREHPEETTDQKDPSLAQVLGILFDVMFLDHLAADIEHLERLNQLLSSGAISQSGIEGCERMRPLATLLITPSVSLSKVAQDHQRDMPYLIQYFINSLGRDAGFMRRSDELFAIHIALHQGSH